MQDQLIITKPDTLSELVSKAVRREFEAHQSLSDNDSQNEVFTNRQAMEYLHVSRSTLQRWRNEGKLPYRKIQGKILYTREDIESMLEEAAK